MTVTLHTGDCRQVLRTLPDCSVNTCVTSPPYFGLRDYGVDGQLGLKQTPDEYIASLVEVFREVRRVLRKDGTLWLNIGDSYAGGGCGARDPEKWPKQSRNDHMPVHAKRGTGLRNKDLMLMPARVAIALQADGWYVRQDIIWNKPNAMPESVRDRCTKAHEYLFLLSKSNRYYFDSDAIMEPVAASTVSRLSQPRLADQAGSLRVPGKTNGPMKAVGKKTLRNKRSVWTVATQPYKGAHFATFPKGLIRDCILAGCPAGGTVLDPFGGAGTTGLMSEELGRDSILIELNPGNVDLSVARLGLAGAAA